MEKSQISDPNGLIERLKSSWAKQGVRIRPGASREQIEGFQSKYQFHLPHDFCRYLATVDGMESGEMDENMFSFLAIDAIKSIPEELATFGGIPDYTAIMRSLTEPHHWFVFVDYLITSAAYAIRLSLGDESTPVLWIGNGTRYRVVAESFSGFLEAYLSNPDSLL